MIFIEILDEVFTEILAQRFFNKIQIVGKVFLAESESQKLFELSDNIIDKPFLVQNRDNAVSIRDFMNAMPTAFMNRIEWSCQNRCRFAIQHLFCDSLIYASIFIN